MKNQTKLRKGLHVEIVSTNGIRHRFVDPASPIRGIIASIERDADFCWIRVDGANVELLTHKRDFKILN